MLLANANRFKLKSNQFLVCQLKDQRTGYMQFHFYAFNNKAQRVAGH